MPTTPRLLATEQSTRAVDDMADLEELSEASILHNIRLRFEQKKVFTAVGPVLISTNPFQTVNLFTPETLEAYLAPNKLLPPHIYGLARGAYEALALQHKDQALLIAGESGAGKTELTKLFLQFIVDISTRRSSGDATAAADRIHARILTSNPILEAFGNAKTKRNDNSSRFGKWTSLRFDANHGRIVGARILVYLLEKSRLCVHAPGERSFKVFYLLLAGADRALKDKLQLGQADKYRFLFTEGDSPVPPPHAEDVLAFNDLLRALRSVGIGAVQEAELVQVLAGVLHLGNVEFTRSSTSVKGDVAALEVANRDVLTLAAQLLGMPADALELALVSKDVSNAKEAIKQHRSEPQARDTRDGLAKSLYAKLFDWITTSINTSLTGSSSKAVAAKQDAATLLGVFDIFGFEIFDVNSFEQLCINYANEKLQELFSRVLVSLQRNELAEQGVAAALLNELFPANSAANGAVLPAFEDKAAGLFALIEDEALLPRGSDESLVAKIKPSEVVVKSPGLAFTVRHFAGPVEYDARGVLDKARDRLEPALEQLLLTSSMGLVADAGAAASPALTHLNERLTAVGKRASIAGAGGEGSRRTSMGVSSKARSLASKFQQQLGELVDSLVDTQMWFARCIKPNAHSSPTEFDSRGVLAQLASAGVLQVCRLRQRGFPVHIPKSDFAWRYAVLGGDVLATLPTGQAAHVGATKVLLQAKTFDALEARRAQALSAHAVAVQRVFRGHAARQSLSGVRAALVSLAQALQRDDADAVRAAMRLLLVAHVPEGHPALVKARVVLQAHEEMAMARRQCAMAMSIEDALVAVRVAEAAGVDKNDSHLVRCRQLVAAGDAARKLRAKIGGHIGARLLSPLLASVDEARAMLAAQPAVQRLLAEAIAEGESLAKRLQAERDGLEQANAASQSNDARRIEHALSTLVGLGLGLHASAQSLQRQLNALAPVSLPVASSAPAAATAATAAVTAPAATATSTAEAERKTQVERTLVRLKTAEKMQSLRELEGARRDALQLGLDQDADVQRAAQLQSALAEKNDLGAALEAACTALRMRAESSKFGSSVRAKDVEALAEAVAVAKQRGLAADSKPVQAALALEARVRAQVALQARLEAALRGRDVNALRAALEETEAAHVDNDLVRRVRALVKRRKAGKTTTPHDRMWEVKKLSEKDIGAQRAVRLALVAGNPAFDFVDYAGLRSDVEYASAKAALYKCAWTGAPIPGAMTKAAGTDAGTNKRAVIMNRAVLGFCGDVVMPFANQLAVQVLESALQDPLMADELYCQLLKQLSGNREPESDRRAWRLAAVLCSCVGPADESLENVVLRFLTLKVDAADGAVEREVARYAQRKFERLLSLGASGVMPTADEVQAFLLRPPMLASVSAPDGAELVRDYPVGPEVDAGELVDSCCQLAGLSPAVHALFGVFIDASARDAQERRLRFTRRYRIVDPPEFAPRIVERAATGSSSEAASVASSPMRPSSLATASAASLSSSQQQQQQQRRSLNPFRRFSRRPTATAQSPGGFAALGAATTTATTTAASERELDLAALVASRARLAMEVDCPLSQEPVLRDEFPGDLLVTRAAQGGVSLVLKRRRVPPQDEDAALLRDDAVYAQFVFREVAHELLAGHWGLPDKQAAADFAALFWAEAHGGKASSLVPPSALDDFVPAGWRGVVTDEDWLVLVSDAVKKLPRFADVGAVRMHAVSKAQGLHCYAMSTFHVRFDGQQVVLGVNGVGLHLLAADPMRTSARFLPHKRIVRIVPSSEALEVHAWRAEDDDAIGRIETLRVATLEARQIADMLGQYGAQASPSVLTVPSRKM